MVKALTSLTVTSRDDGAPETPAAAPLLWTVVGYARRQSSEPQSVSGRTTLSSLAAAPTATASRTGPRLINVIGTAFFTVLEAVEKVIAGPPEVPRGSAVRVGRAPLQIDCGPGGVKDQADWYFPTDDPNPTRLIYLQHGFPGVASEYDYTAARLAERNDAIVVVPTISGNLFNCYGCQLSGDQMHAAVAELFLGDRSALTLSARLASGDPTLVLPQRFVLSGHSGGAQLAAGAAGYFEQFAPDDRTRNNLVGLLLFDVSPVGGAIARGVAKIPDNIPVSIIAAEPNWLDSYGDTNTVLTTARPGQFVGVQLVKGVHNDSMQTHNLLVRFVSDLIGGFPRPHNVEAVQDLAQGWINDWYDGTHTGIYGSLGSTITIPTSAGTATAYVLPAPAPTLTFVDQILKALIAATINLQFAYCATEPQDPPTPTTTQPSSDAAVGPTSDTGVQKQASDMYSTCTA